MSKQLDFNIKDMLEALKNDNNFIKLKQKYEAPNEFTIMGDKRREEWHSSFVSWLLNPKQNHKLGKYPLEKFLELIESKREGLEIDKTDIADMVFETEKNITNGRRIDIWGIIETLVLVVENKIKAKETYKAGIPQSEDYYDFCEKKYKNRQRCYVLLKAFSNTKVANGNYVHITYQDLSDKVIKPSYDRCLELKIEDAGRVLEQYSIDISNPFASTPLADTQKELSDEIYEKHKEIIEKMREAIRDVDRDEKSDICEFFEKNKKYINDVILKSSNKEIIRPRTSEFKKLKGDKLINALLDYGYIKADYTELIYTFKGATCIIQVDKNRIFHVGYYYGDYDGSQEVEEYKDGFETLRAAAWEMELALGSRNEDNGGGSAYEMKLLNSGVEEAEGKKIKEILDKL